MYKPESRKITSLPTGFVWWRLMHQKIPCRQRLYDKRVKDVESPNCVICNNPEDNQHLFWECPSKRSVWNTIANRFISNPATLQFEHLTLPCPPTSIQLTNTTANIHTVLGCTLSAIWSAHFRLVFDDTPFNPNLTAAMATLAIRRVEAEESLDLVL
ncbi:hypothetical protein CLU79DRAFT_712055 [Phycomyces nitens]|nr:hypothetical protein CLU79DRAFT_712055 [Phycomyces nitens]